MLAAQRNEKTEQAIYRRFADIATDPGNKRLLLQLAEYELEHHDSWQRVTGTEVEPYRLKIWLYYLISKIAGITFGLKLMERSVEQANTAHKDLWPDQLMSRDTAIQERELQLLGLINEERLNYIGSIILGLNDALVEFSGALAGFTFALQQPRLVAMTGIITGIAAALSMGSTGYLAAKTEGTQRSPLKSSLYTGITYIATVILLVLPYLVLGNVYVALGTMLLIALCIILLFNFYVAVAKGVSFRTRFTEMAIISLGIAAVSFGIGLLVRLFLGVEA